jgi:hypothetical protein
MYLKIKKFFFLSFFIFGFAGLIDLQTPGFSFTDLMTFQSSELVNLNAIPLAEDFSEHSQKNPSEEDSPNDDFHLFSEPINLKAFLQNTFDSDTHSSHPEPISENLFPPPKQQA